ncbi:hypothetical protein [uncultured Veillonella sp.]|uniref:hypothetical protein n=1 Tax=uncultured Veillonella sp. TaxID=159268 RepID=UPI0026298424|nr:hypothetical protein [uncultured Veillonella sp.]
MADFVWNDMFSEEFKTKRKPLLETYVTRQFAQRYKQELCKVFEVSEVTFDFRGRCGGFDVLGGASDALKTVCEEFDAMELYEFSENLPWYEYDIFMDSIFNRCGKFISPKFRVRNAVRAEAILLNSFFAKVVDGQELDESI